MSIGKMRLKSENQAIDLSQVPCQHLAGVGSRVAERLARLDIYFIQDLLFHLPTRYQDRTRVYAMRDVRPGDHVVIEGVIDQVMTPKVGRTRLFIRLSDETGHCHARFFYVNTAQRQTLESGVRVRCFGEMRLGTKGLEMIHPEYRVLTAEMPVTIEENLTPIYPATDGVSQTLLRKLTQQALNLLAGGGLLQDILPASILKSRAFPDIKTALQFVHRPPADAPVELLLAGKHISQKRLVFEELLAHRLSLLHLKKSFQVHRAVALSRQSDLIKQFIQDLPFQLTAAQLRVADDIFHDLSLDHPMLRLVQGDVGSGKTVVAALGILQTVQCGYQVALLAPTELLAEQHFQTFQRWLTPLNIKVVMLSGQMKVAERRLALTGIADNTIQVVIGTHALFQKEVIFSKLAFIIVDEQHRFGVQQRALLREKGQQDGCYPHQLIMTATPIPRTLAMSVYADLDYSVIDELPPGRTPVMTTVMTNSRRDEILIRIREACASGRQAYWVCTLIEESDVLQCQAAEETAALLQSIFPELKMGLLHGRMKSFDKENIMKQFKQGDIKLLVATTVIEVGVDVPNASLMVIENAERLGLAQLHQLRGRVGRGLVASHCLLMYQAPLSHLAKERLAVMRETTDGFKIAERDLLLRGPGEVLGTRQTGEVAFRIADLIRDDDLLPAVQEAASFLQQNHPDLIELIIKRWVGGRERFGHV